MFNDNIESIFVEVDKSDFSLDRSVVIGVLTDLQIQTLIFSMIIWEISWQI